MRAIAPIPGMSLTKEPGNAPWEQPPLYATVEEALDFYVNKLNDEEVLEEVLFSLEAGYPVEAMVNFLTSHSVMEGLHTFDVKMLVAPVLHEYIVSLAESADIKFVETAGPSKEERAKERTKKHQQVLLRKFMEEDEPSDESPEEMVETPEHETGEKSGMGVEQDGGDMPLIPRRM